MLKRILVAAICVPALVAVILFCPPLVVGILFSVIAAVSAYELLHSMGENMPEICYPMTIAAAAAIPVGQMGTGDGGRWVVWCAAILLMTGLFAVACRRHETEKEITLSQILICLFGGIIIPMLLSSMVSMRVMEQGKLYVLLAVMIPFITDGGAYFVGIFLGKHRGIFKVSPKKSLEGCIGGLLIGVLSSVIFGLVVYLALDVQVKWLALIVAALLTAFITELGDLAFSLVKRQQGIKDFGNLLPGHGGMLDRFDSMVFSAPVLFLVLQLWPVF